MPSVRKLKLGVIGPSNKTMIPTIPHIPDSTVAITVNWLEPYRKSLVGFEDSGCSTQNPRRLL